ncbi:MAG: cupin domain-containing protein [Gemmataceae bacterium]
MPFIDLDQVPSFEIVPGVQTQTPHGENLMLSYAKLDEAAEVPTHHHPHEQAGIVVKGKLELTIAGDTRVLQPGAMYIVPPNVPHSARAIGGPVDVLDIFSPVREDYAKRLNSYFGADG